MTSEKSKLTLHKLHLKLAITEILLVKNNDATDSKSGLPLELFFSGHKTIKIHKTSGNFSSS
jgi:hypothetical protein